MTVLLRSLHAPVAFAIIAIAAQGTSGCEAGSAGVAARAERTLASSYPAQAARILGAESAFERRGDGFARSAEGGAVPRHGGLAIALPRRGEGTFAITTSHLAIGVREIDAEGEGALAGSAVAYRRAGGTSIWTPTPDGAEEWLLLDAGVARADRVAAAWEIEGATAREVAGVIEILDDAGTPRIRVTAPAAWDDSGRPVRATLSAHDHRIELVVDGGGAPVLADPAWSATGTMLLPRGYHAAALLPDGKILVTGGATSGATLASAERFDPVTNAWSAAAPMITPRMGPIATILPGGNVLVAGSIGGPVTAAEVYSPSADAWSSAGKMSASRDNATTTLLADGRVLYVGGAAAQLAGGGPMPPPLASAEIYDPVANGWTMAAPISAGRSAHTAALTPNGKVLIAGGFNINGVIKTVEIYDPAANTWTPGPAMAAGSGYATATTLMNGKVLVVGGAAGPGVAFTRAELFDPATSTWTTTGSLKSGRFYHTATLLPTGQVMVAGGMNSFGTTSTTELYDPASGTWSYGAALVMPRNAHSATLLPTGIIIAAGGMNASTGYLDSAESFGASGSGSTGLACGSSSDCASGYCVDGVCCSTACGAGPCDACSTAAGADSDGTCKLFSGPSCNDGNACTNTDTCQSGVCAGSNPVICLVPDACHATGVCATATGLCSHPQAPDDTPCAFGVCLAGVCGPSTTTTSSGGPSAASASAAASSSAATSGSSGAGGAGSASSASASSGDGGAGSASSTSASSGAGGAPSSSASAGAGGAIGTGDASGTGDANGAGGSLSSTTGESNDGTTGGRPRPTIGRQTVGCTFHASGGASPLGLLFALAALLATQVRRSRSPRPRT